MSPIGEFQFNIILIKIKKNIFLKIKDELENPRS